MPYEWTCPFCDKNSIVTEANSHDGTVWFTKENSHGDRMISLQFIVCPNPKCREFTLSATMYEYTRTRAAGSSITRGKRLEYWPLIPASNAKTFPSYIPKPILDDYLEACLIRDLSPKASATLSRRCLQGMIRDFWGISKGRLIDEIMELKNRVDSLTWSAIDAVRNVGNIGAHMEKDINVIVDVDPEEAAKLIGLIEVLLRDWYILRYERQMRLTEIVEIGHAKKQAKEEQNEKGETAPS
jgi:Domain of unknown function (DUF4145)